MTRYFMLFVLLLCAVALADSTVVDIYDVSYISHGQQVEVGKATTNRELIRALGKLEFLGIAADSIWVFHYQRIYWNEQDSMVMYLRDYQNMLLVTDTLTQEWFDRDTWNTFFEQEQPRYYPMQ